MTNQEFILNIKDLSHSLKGFALKLTRNDEDAKDLVQETLARCFGAKEKFTPGTSFKAWATRIMYNTFVNNYRRQKTRTKYEEYIMGASDKFNLTLSQEDSESKLTIKEIFFLINSLDHRISLPFKLFLNGFHYEEIATILQVSIGTVKSRIHTARKQLKKLIKNHFGEGVLRVA